VRTWEALRDCAHWSGALALHCSATPAERSTSVAEIVTGGERVDLAAALAALHERHGARLVRVDSGGALTGALLCAGLVDELSLLVHPCLAGDERRWHGREPVPRHDLVKTAAETLGDGLVWLRYRFGR
jgi:2,5-diamino-6-(ribosylamino)-4(3H)-pyrimidinone 5'-phosphate reductase